MPRIGSGVEQMHGRSNIETIKILDGALELDSVAFADKTDYADDKINDTHKFAGLMSTGDYANKRAQVLRDVADGELEPEDLAVELKKRDEGLKGRQDAARKKREEEKKRKLQEELQEEEQDGPQLKKKPKGKKKKSKKGKGAGLSFDADNED
jgi:hypothetical protein